MTKVESAVTSCCLLSALLLPLSVLFAPLAIAEAETEYYTWVDERGITNYAEREPKGYETTHVTGSQKFGYKPRRREDPVAAPTEEEVTPTDENGEIDPDAAIEEEKAKYEAELASEKQKNCRLGKQNLARLETYARIRVNEEGGKSRYLTPAEMEEKKQESREAIKFHCSG